MEILAQKKHGAPWQYIILFIIGAVSLIVATQLFIWFLSLLRRYIVFMVLPLLALFGLVIFAIVMSTISIRRIKRTPNQITLNGNQVDLGNGLTVNLTQIMRVDYREARARYYTHRWGTLTIYLENQKVTYYYYDDVQRARDRIMQLVWQSKTEIE